MREEKENKVRRYKKYKIFDSSIEKVPIYESEINVIKKQNGNELQRLLFAILLWSKFSKYHNTTCFDKEIANIAGVHRVKRDIGILLQSVLVEEKPVEGDLIRYSIRKMGKRHFGFYTILFLEKDESKEPLFWVDDIEKCQELFHLYFRDGWYCKMCDNRIEEIRGNNQVYCDDCGKKIRREKVRINVQNFRKRQKS